MTFDDVEEVNHDFAFGDEYGKKESGMWVIPSHWQYDSETGEFINMKTGVVVNRRCFVSVAGTIIEYAIEPDNMLCGTIVKDENGKMHICIAPYTHLKSEYELTRYHRDKTGYRWMEEPEPVDDNLLMVTVTR